TLPEPQSPVVLSHITQRTAQPTAGFRVIGQYRSPVGVEIGLLGNVTAIIIRKFHLIPAIGIVGRSSFTIEIRFRYFVTARIVLPFDLVITYSVFRLAARRTVLCGWILRLECAPVSEKRVGLNRSPVARAMGVECPRTFAGGAPGHPGWRCGAIRCANQAFERSA